MPSASHTDINQRSGILDKQALSFMSAVGAEFLCCYGDQQQFNRGAKTGQGPNKLRQQEIDRNFR